MDFIYLCAVYIVVIAAIIGISICAIGVILGWWLTILILSIPDNKRRPQ